MNPSTPTSRLPLVAAAVLGLLVQCACSKSGSDTGPSPVPGPTTGPGPVAYSALGASDAVGVGSSVPCAPFTPCEDGKGYVPDIARSLKADGHTVTLTNLGIPGAVLAPATQALGIKYGLGTPANLLAQEGPFVPRDTTLVTIFAGGNDTNTVGTAIDRGEVDAAGANAYIDQQVAAFRTDYASLLSAVRGRAPGARVIVLNLPNMAGLPYMAGRSSRDRRWVQRLAVGFSQAANALASSSVFVVDLMCDARSYQKSNYSSDGFHPNDAGYTYIAGEALDAAAATAWAAPSGSCAQMDLVR